MVTAVQPNPAPLPIAQATASPGTPIAQATQGAEPGQQGSPQDATDPLMFQAQDARRQWVNHLGRITQWVLPRPQDPDFGRGPWMDMCILEMMHALRTAPFDIHYAHLTPQRSEALLRQHAEEICAEAWGRGTQGRRERHQYLMSLHPSALPDALRHMAEMRQQTMFGHMETLCRLVTTQLREPCTHCP